MATVSENTSTPQWLDLQGLGKSTLLLPHLYPQMLKPVSFYAVTGQSQFLNQANHDHKDPQLSPLLNSGQILAF